MPELQKTNVTPGTPSCENSSTPNFYVGSAPLTPRAFVERYAEHREIGIQLIQVGLVRCAQKVRTPTNAGLSASALPGATSTAATMNGAHPGAKPSNRLMAVSVIGGPQELPGSRPVMQRETLNLPATRSARANVLDPEAAGCPGRCPASPVRHPATESACRPRGRWSPPRLVDAYIPLRYDLPSSPGLGSPATRQAMRQ